MRRRLALVGLLVALLGVFGMNTAVGAPDEDRNTGNACPPASPQPDNTPPNCGNDGDTGGGGGGGGGDHGTGNACPPTSPNPDGTPPDCGHPPCDDADADGVCDEDDECDDEDGPASNDGCPEQTGKARGPCHRGEGLAGEQDPTQNPFAEQVFHGVIEEAQNGGAPIPAEEPGSKEAESETDNSSLSEPARGFYGGDAGRLGNEIACVVDMVDPVIVAITSNIPEG
jgi:hypothetical protein